jgi:hypothetical protein
MSAAPAHTPIVHFVGSIPLPDAETVYAADLALSADGRIDRAKQGSRVI